MPFTVFGLLSLTISTFKNPALPVSLIHQIFHLSHLKGTSTFHNICVWKYLSVVCIHVITDLELEYLPFYWYEILWY